MGIKRASKGCAECHSDAKLAELAQNTPKKHAGAWTAKGNTRAGGCCLAHPLGEPRPPSPANPKPGYRGKSRRGRHGDAKGGAS